MTRQHRQFVARALACIFLCALTMQATAQDSRLRSEIEKKIIYFFAKYKAKDADVARVYKMSSFQVDDKAKAITIHADKYFAQQNFTEASVARIYSKLSKSLPKPYRSYKVTLLTGGIPIENLASDRRHATTSGTHAWGNIEYRGTPWVENISKPNDITHGLRNRHVSLWASHGRYYDIGKGTWKWQRPNLFGTTEDLFTQTIVVPYLIPMLENAGAVVFSPRERDWQTQEIIIDNDYSPQGTYQERNLRETWQTTAYPGFAWHNGTYSDGENPFAAGTARMAKTTSSESALSSISYQPAFSTEGKYAVYVSYQTVPGSVHDAEYTVYHKGQETTFKVNQQMGGGTWVYLGAFDFDQGCNEYNRVVLTNKSASNGIVTADAVRFGGGMGNIQRGGSASGLPRCLEGARYAAQWAGAPYQVYSGRKGTDDYADDINVRSFMTNWLAGGSVYVPTKEGKNVPIELSLAVHSDAGYAKDSQSLIGSLAICTTETNQGKLASGISRNTSKELAQSLLDGIQRDILFKYQNWNIRSLYDRNYSETRCPEVPSAIIETLSHQNFPDMAWGQDPNFKFTLARSIYKTLAKYINTQHGHSCIIQPLTPDHFRIEFTKKGKVRLSWNAVDDPQEPTAHPDAYILYMATGSSGFDNGRKVKKTSYTMELEPDVPYHFRVTATNRGGESFPTEVLSAVYHPKASGTILIVNGFQRLSSPAIRNTTTEQGFDFDEDPGVTYGLTAGWNGRQQCFDKQNMGIEGPGGLGYSGDEWVGHFIAGNDFTYVRTHADAIASAGQYSIVSCSREAVESGYVKLGTYTCVDYLLGLEKADGHSLGHYKTFSPTMQQKLSAYAKGHGRLIVSGSYVASDMRTATEQEFLRSVLKVGFARQEQGMPDSRITGLGMDFDIFRQLGSEHYAATSTDSFVSQSPAFCAMQYANGSNAAVAYNGNDYKSFVMGFPFECIKDSKARHAVMRGILRFVNGK